MAASQPADLAVVSGTSPVRWWVMDGWGPTLPLAHLPGKKSSIWEARYENDTERHKRTTRWVDEVRGLAPVFDRLRSPGNVNDWRWLLGYDVWDDPTLHGGGLHVTEPGGWLSTHLDYDLHPHVPHARRALNLILFLNPEWREEWGGALVLCDPMGKVVQRIYPKPGRLAAFEVGDLSYHGVEQVLPQRQCDHCSSISAFPTSEGACANCWPGVADGNLRRKDCGMFPPPRVTAAVYFLSRAGAHNTRQRALFLPNRSKT